MSRRVAAKDYSHPDVRYWATTSGMLWWAAAALGVLCMFDTLHQSLTMNAWTPYWPLYYLYYPILAAYAGARDKEKRVRRAQQYEKYTGEFFVYGWGLIVLFIFFGDSLGFAVSWPANFSQTLAVVGGVYLGVKIAVPMLWPIKPFDPDDPNDPDADPARQPAPMPGPNPAPSPAPDKNDLAAQIRQACQAAGTFTSQDIAARFNLSVPKARGYIIQLLLEGVVAKLGHDHFQWKG